MAETGLTKNVENWQKMIAACTGFGAGYAPTNPDLALASMNTLLTDAETEMDGVQTNLVPLKNKVADRENITRAFVRARCSTRGVRACRADSNKVEAACCFAKPVNISVSFPRAVDPYL